MASAGVDGREVNVETVGSFGVSSTVGAMGVGVESVSGVVEVGISEDVDVEAVVYCVSSALGAASTVVDDDDDDLENQPMM